MLLLGAASKVAHARPASEVPKPTINPVGGAASRNKARKTVSCSSGASLAPSSRCSSVHRLQHAACRSRGSRIGYNIYLGLYWVYIGIMENKTETAICCGLQFEHWSASSAAGLKRT